MDALQAYTTAEAAFILEEPVQQFKKTLEKGPVRIELRRQSGSSRRAIKWSDLVFLYLAKELRNDLTPKARTDFYTAFRKIESVDKTSEIAFGHFRIDVSDMIDAVEKKAAELGKLSESVSFREDGEPLIKGSSVEVYRVAALLDGGMSVKDILEDFPSLKKDEVQAAQKYATAHPKPGRPYPRQTAKRALQGAGLDALDEYM